MRITNDVTTITDNLVDLYDRIAKTNYDMEAPLWYWNRSKWNQLAIDKVALQASIRRLTAMEHDWIRYCNSENL